MNTVNRTDATIYEDSIPASTPIIRNMRKAGRGEYYGEYRGRTIRTEEGAWPIGGKILPCQKVWVESAS